MDFSYFFGQDKTPFTLHENGTVTSNSKIPFHGIISRGLLNKLNKQKANSTIWYEHANDLESILTNSSDGHLLFLKECATECKVLTFGQSAACVKLFIESYCNVMINEDSTFCEIWSIKEGHTSSVWKVTISNSDFQDYHFIVNVARDYAAGIELRATSEKMKDITEHCPCINMAKVYDIQYVVFNYYGTPFEVVVTRNEWIKNSYEIYATQDKLTTKEQYLLVERFLTKEDSPSRITSIFGRKFSETESFKIRNDVNLFLNSASEYLPANININEGDVVWDGERAIIVAIS